MGVIISPSGGGCTHVLFVRESDGEVVGTMTVDDYHAVTGIPAEALTPAAVANRTTIETNLLQDLVAMQALIDATNNSINTNPAAHLKSVARCLRRIIRHELNQLDGTA